MAANSCIHWPHRAREVWKACVKGGKGGSGEIHHKVKESTDVGLRGKSTRSHEEIRRSEEWTEARGWMEGKAHNCFFFFLTVIFKIRGHVERPTASVTWHGDLAGGAETGGFKDGSGKWASRPRPGHKQHLGTTCFSSGSCVPDKSCTSPHRLLNFFPIGPSQWKMKLSHQCFDSSLQRGKIPGGADSQLELFVFSICGVCPTHKVLTASFPSSQRLACLLLKGWVRLVRLAKLLAKILPLKDRDPVPVGAVMMWFSQHSAQPGVSKAEALPVPCFSLTSISNTTKKFCYPAVKQMEELDPGWAWCHCLYPS